MQVMMDITHKTTFNQTSRIEGLCPMDTDAYDDDPGVSFQSSSSDIVFKDKLQKILEKFDDEINALNSWVEFQNSVLIWSIWIFPFFIISIIDFFICSLYLSSLLLFLFNIFSIFSEFNFPWRFFFISS